MSESEMKIDPARAQALLSQLQEVRQRVAAAAKGRPVRPCCCRHTHTHTHTSKGPTTNQLNKKKKKVRLVAVSKLKPANDILALHQPPPSVVQGQGISPHVHFGENYAQELASKAGLLPRSVRWHFIGGLQSTHCKTLARVPNLFAVSSLDSAKKASLLDKARGDFLLASVSSEEQPNDGDNDAQATTRKGRINVHIQVNTSGEATKSGCAPGPAVVDLARHVLTQCPHLRLRGLMTIGAIARSVATTAENENEDFLTLRAQRDLVAEELKDLLSSGEKGDEEEELLELSMGMSEDFEGAIAMGSSEVRVGSTIFGARPANKADAKLVV